MENNEKIIEKIFDFAQAEYKKILLTCPVSLTPISHLASVRSGFAFKSEWWSDSGVRVIKIKNITESGLLNMSDCSFICFDKTDKAKEFSVTGGEILIAMTGATIGKFALVPPLTEAAFVNQRVGKFFTKSDGIAEIPFLYLCLMQSKVRDEIISRGIGSAQPNISGKDIESIEVMMPSDEIIDFYNTQFLPLFQKIISILAENEKLLQAKSCYLKKFFG